MVLGGQLLFAVSDLDSIALRVLDGCPDNGAAGLALILQRNPSLSELCLTGSSVSNLRDQDIWYKYAKPRRF